MTIITGMDGTFDLEVWYKNQEWLFPATLIVAGYGYKIEVMVEDQAIVYEPDEEKNYRAYMPASDLDKKAPDPLLLQAIATAIERSFQ